MRFKNFIPVWRLFFSIISIGFIVIAISCSSGSSDSSDGERENPQNTNEYEVGPEGGTIEVKEGGIIHVVTIIIPPGALAQTTKISITNYVDAPDLPNGFATNYHPAIQLTSDAPFMKEVQIKFPTSFTPDSGKMLCAFYWDTTADRWQIAMPESFEGYSMTVNTKQFSYWEWGELILHDVEDEDLYPLLDEAFGPDFMNRLTEAFEDEVLPLINPNNWDYCANQSAIVNGLNEIKVYSKQNAEDSLSSLNITCNVWDHSPTVDDIFYGVDAFIQIHMNYLGETISSEILGIIPYIGDVLSALAKANAQALYEQRLGNLKNQYECIFSEADSALWIDIGVHYAAEAALLGMEVVETSYPCN